MALLSDDQTHAQVRVMAGCILTLSPQSVSYVVPSFIYKVLSSLIVGIRQSAYLYPAIGGFSQYILALCHVMSPILSAEAHIKLVSVSVTVPSLLSMKRSLLYVKVREKKIQKQTSIDEKKIFFTHLCLQQRIYIFKLSEFSIS